MDFEFQYFLVFAFQVFVKNGKIERLRSANPMRLGRFTWNNNMLILPLQLVPNIIQQTLPVFRHIPDICHGSHGYIRGEKICHVEKFQMSIHDRCGEIKFSPHVE